MKFSIINIFIYSFLITLSLTGAYVFKPYSYIDNNKSLIICNKDGRTFEAGWNFIYSFTDKLDFFNGQKAKKLCEYNIIEDYNNSYKTPSEINYSFKAIYTQESTWMDVIFLFLAMMTIGTIITKTFGLTSKSIKPLVLSVLIAILLFFFIMKNPASRIFCHRQIATKVLNFKRDIFKYNIFPIPEEDKHISSVLPSLYKNCLASEGF